jgi:hypothetical protein
MARSIVGVCHADVERVAIDAIKLTVLESRDSVSAAAMATAVDRLRDRPRTSRDEADGTLPQRRQSRKRNED